MTTNQNREDIFRATIFVFSSKNEFEFLYILYFLSQNKTYIVEIARIRVQEC